MKVLMLNGSSNVGGNTFTALQEVGRQLNKEGIDYEIFQIGSGPVRDCIGCRACSEEVKSPAPRIAEKAFRGAVFS